MSSDEHEQDMGRAAEDTIHRIQTQPAPARGDDDAAFGRRLQRLEVVYRTGVALSAERDRDRLLEQILLGAQRLCNAEGGTLYLADEEHGELRFAIVRNERLGIWQGGEGGDPLDLPPIPLQRGVHLAPNHQNVATHSFWERKAVAVEDAYAAEGFDFEGAREFDRARNYRTRSVLAIPLFGAQGKVLGVLQLINATDPKTGADGGFTTEDQETVVALASQAGVALENQQLLEGQKRVLESFIRLLASAIDAKSPHTGAHCERVPAIAKMLAQAACDSNAAPFHDFKLNEEDWYELRIAAYLHDCGKVTTPVHVIDKATKLEALYDRMRVVELRFEVLRRDAELRWLRAAKADPSQDADRAPLDEELAVLEEELTFLRRANQGSEFLSDADARRIRQIATRTYIEQGEPRPLLDEEELENMLISRGTLNERDRRVINEHIVQTIKMLESLPFPAHLKRVPEYAGGHHERMDGTGYPQGLYGTDMSIPARIMAIADVFEALTATDRPYKQGKTLSETVKIMAEMKRTNHLDPDLLDLFIRDGLHRYYAGRFMRPELVDETDDQSLLNVKPLPFDLPSPDERESHSIKVLERYGLSPAHGR